MMAAASNVSHAGDEPSPWIVRFAPLVATGARVIDVACGSGRHAKFFAARGADVTAVDRDPAALRALSGYTHIHVRQLDLEGDTWPLAGAHFDAVVVANYLHRPHFDALVDLVASDGVLLYETFAAGNEVYGRPANPAFLLVRDELAERVRGRLTVVAFEQGLVETHGRRAVVQRLAAVGPDRAWPPELPRGFTHGVTEGETR